MVSNRITKADLDRIVWKINDAAGTPKEPYASKEFNFKPNKGCYHLDGAYGGYKLVQMVSDENGSTTAAINTGYVPKRELYERMVDFLAEIRAKKV